MPTTNKRIPSNLNMKQKKHLKITKESIATGVLVTKNSKTKLFGFINVNNGFKQKTLYQKIESFNDKTNIIHAETEDNKHLLVSTIDGSIISSNDFTSITPSLDINIPSLVSLKHDDKNDVYQFIDSDGQTCINTIYKKAYPFSNGLACVQDLKTEKWGFIDISGTLQIPFEYENAQPFHNGAAPVYNATSWGFINSKNITIYPHRFTQVTVCGDYFNVYKDSKMAVCIPTHGRRTDNIYLNITYIGNNIYRGIKDMPNDDTTDHGDDYFYMDPSLYPIDHY